MCISLEQKDTCSKSVFQGISCSLIMHVHESVLQREGVAFQAF